MLEFRSDHSDQIRSIPPHESARPGLGDASVLGATILDNGKSPLLHPKPEPPELQTTLYITHLSRASALARETGRSSWPDVPRHASSAEG